MAFAAVSQPTRTRRRRRLLNRLHISKASLTSVAFGPLLSGGRLSGLIDRIGNLAADLDGHRPQQRGELGMREAIRRQQQSKTVQIVKFTLCTMPLKTNNSPPTVDLTLQSGSKASATIALFGATVTSWKSSDGQERLFLSKKTTLDGSGAIRGGIPIVFPVFGPPTDHENNAGLENAPRHGFARTNWWHLQTDSCVDGSINGKEYATAVFLLDSKQLKGITSEQYQWRHQLRYVVTLGEGSLTTSLEVAHVSDPEDDAKAAPPPMRFQALLHNYLSVPDHGSASAKVEGLQGQSYLDKTETDAQAKKTPKQRDSAGAIQLQGAASDTVHLGPTPQIVTLRYGDRATTLLRDTDTTPNTVLWNPAAEGNAGMKDLHEDGWKDFICIEPGKVVGFEELKVGQVWTASQTLSASL
ncbi:unnamed protein product [Sympodiomycopsis kandeliae]